MGSYASRFCELTTCTRYLQLSPEQCEELVDTHHVHMPKNGRINVSGLNERNIERVARAIDEFVRKARVGEGVVDQGSM